MERRGRQQVRREEHDFAVAELRPPRDGRRDGRELRQHGEEVGVGRTQDVGISRTPDSCCCNCFSRLFVP